MDKCNNHLYEKIICENEIKKNSKNNLHMEINKVLRKPKWLKIKTPLNVKPVNKIKKLLRLNNLNTVCEEALCPNLLECFSQGTATFMILGDICTRKCTFCAVKKGRPNIVDSNEPKNLANAIFQLKLKYVVLTSVARDDLRDGGASHFSLCIQEIRKLSKIKIEILVPDFRGKEFYALNNLSYSLPDIFNHNIESVPRLYSDVRPGANYKKSLQLLYYFKDKFSDIPTKSGLMLGLGEKKKEVFSVMSDLRLAGVSMLTVGQYLQPSKKHINVKKYITLNEFNFFKEKALSLGFTSVFCGPWVRSSYHAYEQSDFL